MKLFGRGGRSSGTLPRGTAERMALFGRSRKDRSIDVDEYETFIRPHLDAISRDEVGFVEALSALCRPLGGWTVYGAAAYVLDAVHGQAGHPEALAMLDEGVAFLISQGYGPDDLTGYETARLG